MISSQDAPGIALHEAGGRAGGVSVHHLATPPPAPPYLAPGQAALRSGALTRGAADGPAGHHRADGVRERLDQV